jgi:PAS domain S-box-containing protein
MGDRTADIADVEDREVRLAFLEAELARYRTVFDAAHVGLAETDAQGIVRLANARLARFLGVSPSFVVGKPLLHFVVRADTRAFRSVVKTLDQRAEHEAFRVRLRPRHGSAPFPVEVWARAARARLTRCYVWTIRAHKEERPDRAAENLLRNGAR